MKKFENEKICFLSDSFMHPWVIHSRQASENSHISFSQSKPTIFLKFQAQTHEELHKILSSFLFFLFFRQKKKDKCAR